MKNTVFYILILLLLIAVGYLPFSSSKIIADKVASALKATDGETSDLSVVTDLVPAAIDSFQIANKNLKNDGDRKIAGSMGYKPEARFK